MADLNELVNNEQESPSIKNSDQLFIQNNYQSMSLEQICAATELPPDVVTSYIETYEQYMKDHGINPNKRFVLHINLDALGNVSYGMDWPDIQSIEKLLPFVGKLFFMINSGQFKQSMANFLGRYAEERGAYTVVKNIMETWNKHEKAFKELPLIEPHEVFKDT